MQGEQQSDKEQLQQDNLFPCFCAGRIPPDYICAIILRYMQTQRDMISARPSDSLSLRDKQADHPFWQEFDANYSICIMLSW